MIPTEGRKHFVKKRLKNRASAGKWTKEGAVGTCNAYVVGPGAAARGRTHFYSRILIKKKERLTTAMQRGARWEHTFGSNAPRDAQEREEGTRTGDGTRDHERI